MKVMKMKVLDSKIKGSVKISGSKNSSLPIIAASLVSSVKTTLYNVPNISDINNLLKIINKAGCDTSFKNNKLVINNRLNDCELLFDEVKKIRASYYLMSVFIALFGKVTIYYPGGCSLGSRPIDYHLEGFKAAGCVVSEDGNVIKINASKLKPFIYKMERKSLGATVNLIILASKIHGRSVIKNASTEPEIDDLIDFINKGYSKVYRKGSDIIVIGNTNIKDKIKHKVIPDRIECFTYMCIGLTSDKLKIKNINPNHLTLPIYYFKEANANIKVYKNSIVVKRSKLKSITGCSGDYPSLSTDQMPLLYPFFSRVDGISVFTEGIFENRFNVCDELKRKGACINVEKNKVIINGCSDMKSNQLYPKDLRAAASLLIECIIDQKSQLHNLYYLERGYDNIYKKLKKIGLKFELE